jgi:hypothetical protein
MAKTQKSSWRGLRSSPPPEGVGVPMLLRHNCLFSGRRPGDV